MKEIKSNVDLVIRDANKGCSVVAMDRQRYIEERHRQLNDTSVYLSSHATAISVIEEDIQHLADQIHIDGVITDDVRQFAIRRDSQAARFYLLPMVHKKVYHAEELLLRAVLPLKKCQKYWTISFNRTYRLCLHHSKIRMILFEESVTL